MKRKVADRKLDWLNDSEARGSTASQEKWGKKTLFICRPHIKNSAHQASNGLEEMTVLSVSPQSSEGFGRDAHGEGAGLQTAGMQGFVLWLFRSAFLKLCGWRSPFSTWLQDIEAVTLPLFWPETHHGDGWPPEWMRKQGGSICQCEQSFLGARFSFSQMHTFTLTHVRGVVIEEHFLYTYHTLDLKIIWDVNMKYE